MVDIGNLDCGTEILRHILELWTVVLRSGGRNWVSRWWKLDLQADTGTLDGSTEIYCQILGRDSVTEIR